MAAQAQAQQSTAVAKIEPRAPGVVGDVQRMEKQFALALPEHVSPEKFVRVVMTAINTNPDLQKADRQSVLAAAMKCAQDGLLPDGREAALVTYGNKASYLPMIAGVLTKVRRSGELLSISAHVVYAKDVFSYTLGDNEKIEHQPYMEGDRGKAVAVYAVAKTKDGGIYREVMSIAEVEQVRNVSRAKNNGPWVQWWGEMARKTVLRRLAKRLPMSTDLMQVFQRDDEHYDLSRAAQGAATMRRLHADFDEPQEPATEAEVTDAPTGAADDFPGDRNSDFDAVAWADQVMDSLDQFGSVEDLDAFTNDATNVERFELLKGADAVKAKALDAAVLGRRKALASMGQD
ncbi:recombinase RecT [Phenylobacterium sp. J426]|uniref:recombinase RecT n=1 Tax=Phenylobacterium sp. J426 TaxID=2898439 RepID=UPI00215199F2|nr:recombinase RecT [Phenylobacterium sp. J426]MCR5875121.1 recombinase RecT [Phenylobacterium sp. J426]